AMLSASLFRVLIFDPCKEGLLVNQDAATRTADNLVKSVRIGIKNKMAQTAQRGPCMMFWPFRQRDKARCGGVLCHSILLYRLIPHGFARYRGIWRRLEHLKITQI